MAETNNIQDFTGGEGVYSILDQINGTVHWDDPSLKKIIRLRLLSDPGHPYWEVSYCWGKLKDGTLVDVTLPFYQIPKKGFSGFIIKRAAEEKVYAKGLGLFDAISKFS